MPFPSDKVEVVAGHAGPTYGVPHHATIEALRLAGRLEALVLDPVYSAKGLAGTPIPPEARTAIGSLKQAECSVYEVHDRRGSLSSILTEADRAMESRGCERLVGVIQRNQLVAVYVPRDMDSTRDIKASVLVLDRHQLVCVTARANAR